MLKISDANLQYRKTNPSLSKLENEEWHQYGQVPEEIHGFSFLGVWATY